MKTPSTYVRCVTYILTFFVNSSPLMLNLNFSEHEVPENRCLADDAEINYVSLYFHSCWLATDFKS